MPVQSVSIELERESGFFYAGELVRGTVSVTASKDVTCRGVRIRLRGKSHCHWHTGSGDNRTDYDGSTVFQDQNHTLFGNYFATGLLDNAGSDAIFGEANGDGTIYISCSRNEENGKMDLVVRVRDSDFGKRDDNLGEILIDAANIARSGDKQSFPLTRNGRPEKGEVTISAKFLPFEAMFPVELKSSGVKTSSIAMAQRCLVLTVHQATGLRKADWVGKNDVYVQAYRPSVEIKTGKSLPGPDKKIKLPLGKITFPFSFQLRNDTPGSAEIPAGDRAYVRYDLYSNVVFAKWRDPCRRRTISVFPNRPVPTLLLLAPLARETPNEPIFNMACCGMRCSRLTGSVSVTLRASRYAFAPGEELDVSESKVVNETTKTLSVSLVLRQYIMLTSSRGSTTRTQKDFTILKTESLPGKPLLFQSISPEILSSCRIPLVYPSFFGGMNFFSKTGRGGVRNRTHPSVKWTYCLELRVGVEKSTCASAVYARAPILISTTPPFPERVVAAAQDSRDNAEHVGDDPWLLEQHAVVGPEPCDTTPRLTGPEDGGVVTPATGFGMINTIDFQEDQGAVGAQQPYQPVVLSFGEQQKFDVDTVASGNNDTTATPLTTIVADAYDKRGAVGQWVVDHPNEARTLTPGQVAEVLSQVTFSLEQPSVAAELAAGFESSDSLTCAHIVAAMRACEYQMSDVAKIMAPYVNDPENKEVVLREVRFSFERDDIAREFRS